MALAPGYFIGRVIAAWPPFSVALTLWLLIMAALGVAWRPLSFRTCRAKHSSPAPRCRPGANSEYSSELYPQRELMGQHPPATAATAQVEYGVDHLPQVGRTQPPAPFGWRQQRFNNLPLRISQIARISSAFGHRFIGRSTALSFHTCCVVCCECRCSKSIASIVTQSQTFHTLS